MWADRKEGILVPVNPVPLKNKMRRGFAERSAKAANTDIPAKYSFARHSFP
jgi:hypothetical protein